MKILAVVTPPYIYQEGKDIVVNSIAVDVWVYKYELTGALSDEVESWD